MSAAKFSRCGEYFAVCGRDPMAQVSLWVVKKQKKPTCIRYPVKLPTSTSPSSIPRRKRSLQRLQPSDRVRSRSDDTLENKHKCFAQLKNKMRKQCLRRERMENLILLSGQKILDAAERKASLGQEAYLELLLSRSDTRDSTGSVLRLHSSLDDLRNCVPMVIEEERDSQVALEMKDVSDVKEEERDSQVALEMKDVSDVNESKAERLTFSDSHENKDVVNIPNSTLGDISVSGNEDKISLEEFSSDNINDGEELPEFEKIFNQICLSLKEVSLKFFDKKDTDCSSSRSASVDAAAESASSSDYRYESASETLPQMSDVANSVGKVNAAEEKTSTTEQDLEVKEVRADFRAKYNALMQDTVRGVPGLLEPDEVILDPRERDYRIQQVLKVALENAKKEGNAAALLREQLIEVLKITISGFEAFRGQSETILCMHDYIMLQLEDDIADDRVPLEPMEGFRNELIKICEYLQSANKEVKSLIFQLGHQYMKFKKDKIKMV